MSPDLPELAWPVYRFASFKAPLLSSYFDKVPRKFAPLIVEIVKREGPIHIDVIMERLAGLGEVNHRDRRLGRIAMGATHQARQDGLLREADDYWVMANEPVSARDHRGVAGLAGNPRYISRLEIADGAQKVIAFCPSRTIGEWLEITSRSFGFDNADANFIRAIRDEIETVNA